MAPSGRRSFLVAASALLASPLARSQERQRRIACLFGGSPRTHARVMEAFRQGLGELGWIEGRNVALEMHWAEGRMDRVPSLAAEIVRSKPDVILTAANPIVAELTKATRSIPIVMATGADPVESGLVASLGRPGGNLTGLAGFYESTPVKMLELAGAIVPRGANVAVMVEKNSVVSRAHHREAFANAAKSLGLVSQVHEIATLEDAVRVIEDLAQGKAAALVILPGPTIFAVGGELVRRAERLAIPAIYPFEEMADAGGLMSYASNLVDSYRRAARYVDRILRGANPGELPMEQPTQLWLAVNLRAANARGIRIPPSILQRADRVIE